MCDYGVGRNITKSELEQSFDKALAESHNDIKILLLNTYGSIFDSNEISKECFKSLVKKIKETSIKNIIFETHYDTVTKQTLSFIKEELKNKNISIELGLETVNEEIRENKLLKIIDNRKFRDAIELIHSFKMKVITNILVGIPFLSTKEQLHDTLTSIQWCIDNNVDEIDLFPINIKPYTLLMELYKNNEYQVVSHWLLIEVLDRVPTNDLSKIYIAWYGNRKMKYTHGEISILPTACPKCIDKLMNFYKEYLAIDNALNRKQLIKELIANTTCNCYKQLKHDLNL